MSETLYIQINRNIQVDKREITIGDVAALLCKNAGITARVKTIKLITLPDVPKRRVSFSVITVMEKIEKIYPDLQLVSIGESDFIVDYIRQKKKSRVWQGLMVAFVSVFTFVGSAYAIMAYNNDVSTNEIFEKVYEMMGTGNFQEYKVCCWALSFSTIILRENILRAIRHRFRWKWTNMKRILTTV